MTLTREFPRKRSDQELRTLEGERPESHHFDTVISDDTDGYDANSGRVIFRFRKCVVSKTAVDLAREIFGDVDLRLPPSYSRNSAAGRLDLKRVQAVRHDVKAVHASPKNPFAGQYVLKSGRRLRSNRSNPVKSFLAGYNYDRYRKLGHLGGFSKTFPEDWAKAVPFFDAIGALLDRYMPTEASRMRRWCEKHSVKPAFTIGGTCLSTVAVNVNYDSCFHYDRGDMREGYSTLTAIRAGGSYDGGHLVLPGYGIAIDIQEGDILFNQSHVDLHGNGPITCREPGAKRISFVTYLKEVLRLATNKRMSSRSHFV